MVRPSLSMLSPSTVRKWSGRGANISATALGMCPVTRVNEAQLLAAIADLVEVLGWGVFTIRPSEYAIGASGPEGWLEQRFPLGHVRAAISHP